MQAFVEFQTQSASEASSGEYCKELFQSTFQAIANMRRITLQALVMGACGNIVLSIFLGTCKLVGT